MCIFCLHVLTIGKTTKPQPSWMGEGGTSPNRGRGPDLTACLVGLRSHSRLHWGRCSTRTGPKYKGSSVYTESLCMYVGYTDSFSIRIFVNTYDAVHIVLIKIHIVFTIAYNTYWACGGFFFSEIRSPRMERYTLFLGKTPPFSPPKKTCLFSRKSVARSSPRSKSLSLNIE